MRNNVSIRMFAVEQVVKMWCMDKVSVDDLIGYAKRIEEYIVSDAQLDDDELDEETRKKNLALSWDIAKRLRESEARREALEYMNESTERFMRMINDDNNEVGAILPS